MHKRREVMVQTIAPKIGDRQGDKRTTMEWSKPNPATYKNYTPSPSGIYLRYAKLVQY